MDDQYYRRQRNIGDGEWRDEETSCSARALPWIDKRRRTDNLKEYGAIGGAGKLARLLYGRLRSDGVSGQQLGYLKCSHCNGLRPRCGASERVCDTNQMVRYCGGGFLETACVRCCFMG